MVDPGIKKVRIPSEEFPLVQFTTLLNAETERQEIDYLYYDFRYRIVSEDKNRFSHWSSIKRNIQPNVTSPFPHTELETTRFSITKSQQNVINAVWSFIGDLELSERTALLPTNPNYISPDQANLIRFYRKTRIYDVWIRWANVNSPTEQQWTPWEFETSLSSNNFSILQKVGTKRIEIAIQAPTTIKVRDYNNNRLTLFRGISDII